MERYLVGFRKAGLVAMAMPAKRQPKDAATERSKSLVDRLAALAKEFEQEVTERKQAGKKQR
jgi:hypothetical protein